MNDKDGFLIGWLIGAVIAAFIILCIFVLSGCALLGGQTPDVPDTPQQVLYRTVSRTNWLATAAIVGIAVSAFAFLNGNKMGIAGMVSCFIALSMTLAVARYAAWLAAGGAIGSVGLLIYSIFVKDRALKEIVQGNEYVKAGLSTDKPEIKSCVSDVSPSCIDAAPSALFAESPRRAFTNLLGCAQSPTTEKIVKKVKKQINGVLPHTACEPGPSCCEVTDSSILEDFQELVRRGEE